MFDSGFVEDTYSDWTVPRFEGSRIERDPPKSAGGGIAFFWAGLLIVVGRGVRSIVDECDALIVSCSLTPGKGVGPCIEAALLGSRLLRRDETSAWSLAFSISFSVILTHRT